MTELLQRVQQLKTRQAAFKDCLEERQLDVEYGTSTGTKQSMMKTEKPQLSMNEVLVILTSSPSRGPQKDMDTYTAWTIDLLCLRIQEVSSVSATV